MALIFYLSAQEAVGPELPALTRVIAHFSEYALLAALWVWALAPVLGQRSIAAAARDQRRCTRSATSTTRASSRAATPTRSTSSSTAAGSRSRSGSSGFSSASSFRVGVGHPADRLAVPAHVAGHGGEELLVLARGSRRRSARPRAPSRASAAGRASRRRRRGPGPGRGSSAAGAAGGRRSPSASTASSSCTARPAGAGRCRRRDRAARGRAPPRGSSRRPSVARGLHSTKLSPSSVTMKSNEIWPV